MSDDRDTNPLDDEVDDNYEFLGRVDLDDDGIFQADVFKSQDNEDASDEDLHPDIDRVLELMGLDIHDEDVLIDALTTRAPDISTTGFDFNSPNGRGGYDKDELIRFLRETGWLGVVDIYYDEGLTEYFIELPENSDTLKTP